MPDNDILLKAVHDLSEDIKKGAAETEAGLKTRDEELAKVTERLGKIEEIQRQQRHAMPPDAPLTKEQGEAATSRWGFRSLGLKKALEMPTSHPILRGSDRDELLLLHDYHDAVVMKFHIWKKRHDETTAKAKLLNDIDFKTYAAILERNGFMKANEIMNPAASPQASLIFSVLSSQLIEKFRLDLVVGAQFDDITLTRASQKVPTQTNDARG